jgi:hypothetical protein
VVVLLALAASPLAACTKDHGSAEKLCAALKGGSFASVFNGFDPADPAKALDQLRTARVDLGELKDQAPKAQRADLQIEIDYVQDLVDAVAPLGDDADVTQVAAAIQTTTKAHPDVDKAAARLAAFQKASC